MQSAFIGSLMEIAEKDKRVLYLTADSGEGGLDLMFRRNFPDRSFEFGISEENMVAVAAGLAASDKIPFIYTAAPFLAYRSYEFIRIDACLQNLPVKIVGSGSGISVCALGPTHHTTEDISVLRALPNIRILSPATPLQAGLCIKEAYKHDGPVYIRLGMNKEKEFFADDYSLSDSGFDVIASGNDVVIISTGSILEETDESVKLLKENGISAGCVNLFDIKHFDLDRMAEILRSSKLICTVEEHNIYGGLGSIISDLMVDQGINRELVRIGLNDAFTKGYSNNVHLLRAANGLDAESIVKRIREKL